MSANSPDQQFLRDIAKEVAEQGVRPRNVPQLVSAGFGFRFCAVCIDAIFYFVFLVGVFILALLIDDFDGPPLHMSRANWVLFLFELMLAGLYLSCNARFGRTLGKMLIGLRVVCRSGREARSRRWLRWFLQCLPLILGAMFAGWRLLILSAKADGTFKANFLDREATMWFPVILFLALLLLALIPIGPGRVAWYDHVADTYISRRTSRPVARGFEPIL